MAGLSRGQDEGRCRLGLRGDRHRTWCEEGREVASAGATIVCGEGRQDGVGVSGADAEQVLAEQFVLARQGNSRGPHALLVQGIGELEERSEGGRGWRLGREFRCRIPEQREGRGEVAAVAEDIPERREPADPGKVSEIHQARAEDFIGRSRVVDHGPLGIVSDDRGSTEPLEDADLDFLRPKCEKAVEALAETVEVLTGQAGDEVGMDMDAGARPQPSEVVLHPAMVLPTGDQLLDVRVEGLDADFELERPRWKLRDEFAQGLGESVGNHLEMDEEPLGPPFEEELEDAPGNDGMQVERPVHELELADAPIEQRLHRVEKAIEGELADRDVEGREAEFAGERATAGSLDVDDPMRTIAFVVEGIGELELGRIRDRGVDRVGRFLTGDELPAEVGEREVGFTGDDVVGERGDLLLIGLVAHLGSAQDDDEIGIETAEDGDQFGRGPDVPDVDTQPKNGRASDQDLLGDVERTLVDVELPEGGKGLEFTEVGQQVTQPERRVRKLGVERGEQDPVWGSLADRTADGQGRVDGWM